MKIISIEIESLMLIHENLCLYYWFKCDRKTYQTQNTQGGQYNALHFTKLEEVWEREEF